jgi:two-component system, LytTR family, response regulator
MDSKLRCLCVDDEPLALDLLEDNISRFPFLEMTARCHNAFEAMVVLNRENIDLIFLDIQMPSLNGLDFLKTLTNKPMVIFLTAYKQHALESYELNVLDYLLKPTSFERFSKAVNKAYELFMLKQNTPKVLDKEQDSSADFFMVNADYSLLKIVISDVIYVEGLKDYIKIFLSKSAKPVITRLSMKELEEKLPPSVFQRVHKSFIVNLSKVTAVRKRMLVIDNQEIPVTDMYRTAVGQYFNIDLS